jgi:DNA polymerase
MGRITSAARDATPSRPAGSPLPALAREARRCRNCELWEDATQVVFGDGARDARIVLIGEQPGDVEDRRGQPFVGPAGRVLATALADAGLTADEIYVTNAVKHFRFEERGKRRIHKRPGATHINACRPWLERELQAIRPRVVVCLGSVATRSVLGASVRVTRDAGRSIPTPYGMPAVVTIHPSSVLRAPDSEARAAAMRALVSHLSVARKLSHRAGTA